MSGDAGERRDTTSRRGDPTVGASARVQFVPSPIADPGPLGLAAFALTTFVLSMFNADLVSKGGEPVVFGLALAYGGLAQILAGMWEFRTGNTFGAVAFSSYGAFWLSFWALVVFYEKSIPEADAGHAVGLFLIAWGIFTLYMSVAALRTTAAVLAVFSCYPSRSSCSASATPVGIRTSSSSAAGSGLPPRPRRGTRRSRP
jgi:uncharacterized protein